MATTDHKIRLSAIDKTKSAFRSLNKSLRGIRGAVFSFKTALVGAFGAAGVGFAIKQSLEATDQLAKTANRIGTTTEALSKLQFAGKIAGLETRTLNMALQRFVRRTAEVAKGTGEAQGALADLNLDANKLIKMPLDQRFLALADAFSNVENESEKLRLAFKLFDSEGAAVVQLLNEGSDSMRAFFQDAETLGLVMRQDAADGVQRANDAIAKLVGLFQGVLSQTVAALAPALEKLADVIRDNLLVTFEALGGSVEAFGKQAANFILRAVSEIIEGMATFVRTIQAVINKFEDMLNFFEGLAGMTRTTKTDFEGLASSFDRAADFVDSLAFATRDLNVALGGVNEEVDTSITFIDKLVNAFKELEDIGKDTQDRFNKGVKQAFDSTTDALTDFVTGAKSAKDAFKDMARSIVKDLIRMQIQQSITKPLFGMIQESLPSLGSFGGNQAAGGSVMKNKRYLIGERGPEMFVPNQSGRIVSNDDMSGSPVNVTLNITTGVSQTVRAEIANLMPQIANATKAAVADARMRGGSFSGAMGV